MRGTACSQLSLCTKSPDRIAESAAALCVQGWCAAVISQIVIKADIGITDESAAFSGLDINCYKVA